MRYSGLILNDFTAAPGVCVSFFVQGCPHRCPSCHNPEAWEFEGGKEFTNETLDSIIKGISANGISRNLCIMGGEPLCAENAFLTTLIIKEVKKVYPNIHIFVWTGYTYEDLKHSPPHAQIEYILNNITALIDGPYIEKLRDTTLQMRGSSNQRILSMPMGMEVAGICSLNQYWQVSASPQEH